MKGSRAMRLAAVLCIATPVHGQPAAWIAEKRESVGISPPVRAVVLTARLSELNLRIVSVPFETRHSMGTAELSLRDFVREIAATSQYRGRDFAVTNGGFSSYRADVPLGLLVIDGKTYSTLSRETSRTTQGRASTPATLRWSGVLCRNARSRQWEIIDASRYRDAMCTDALQAGPLVVEPGGRPGITEQEAVRSRPFRRTIVCLTGDDAIRVVVTETETALLPLSKWLAAPESSRGLGCSAALNLSGDSSSGLAVVNRGSPQPTYYGDGTFPLPTAIVIEKARLPSR